MTDHIDVVFDGPPGPEGCRLIEVKDVAGNSIRFGTWIERSDGRWALRITAADFASSTKGADDRRKQIGDALQRAAERVRREGPGNGRLRSDPLHRRGVRPRCGRRASYLKKIEVETRARC